ncbi:MAG TPA: ATP synthase F1 subunit epsilon [Armatimonadetes bacterium]|nr:ATP synthase F1 subunit epsilon [Armatimonadota bacterium]
MAGYFSLDIITPERVVYTGAVVSLQAPGLDGLFGVLHNRAPLLAALGPGQVSFVTREDENLYLAISGGLFEVANNRAMLLAEEAAFANEIDLPAAEARLEAAIAARGALSSSEAELDARQTEVEIAEAWVKVGQTARH